MNKPEESHTVCEACGSRCASLWELSDPGEQWSLCSGCDPGLDEENPGRIAILRFGPKRGAAVDSARIIAVGRGTP